MGNSTGNLKKYWEKVYANPRIQGAYIWDWVDQGFWKTTDSGVPYYAYGGDFGDFPNDGNFCINGLVLPNRDVHPGINEVKLVYQPIYITPINAASGNFRIFNHHNFTPLLGYVDLVWRLTRCGTLVSSGTTVVPNVPPGEQASIVIDFNIPSRKQIPRLPLNNLRLSHKRD